MPPSRTLPIGGFFPIAAVVAVLSGGVLLLFVRSAEDRLAIPFLVFAVLFVGAVGWLVYAVSVWSTARARGWLLDGRSLCTREFDEVVGIGARRIPPRAEMEALPSFQADAPEVVNLHLAMQMAQGWEAETIDEREMVTIHHGDAREMAELMRQSLVEEGFRVLIDESVPVGSYRVGFGVRLLVPRREEAAARAFLAEHFGDDSGASPPTQG